MTTVRWKHPSTLILACSLFAVIAAAIVLLYSLRQETRVRLVQQLEEARTLRAELRFDEAGQRLDAILAVDAAHPEARILQAEIMARADPETARALAEGVDLRGLNESARLRAVQLYLQLEEPDEARLALESLESELFESAAGAFARAQFLIRVERDGIAAREALEAALQADPDHVEARQWLARLLFQFGNVVEQTRAKSLARELDAAGQLPLDLLGRMLFQESSPLFRDEIVAYGQRLLAHPDYEASPFYGDLAFYRVMARRFKLADRLDLALEMERARAEHPEAELNDRFSFLDVAMRTGELEGVAEASEGLRADHPEDLRSYLLAGGLAHLRGEVDGVAAALDGAMAQADAAHVVTEMWNYLESLGALDARSEVLLAARLFEVEEASPDQRLRAASVLAREAADESEREALIGRVQAEMKPYPVAAGLWLLQHAGSERAYAFVREAHEAGGDSRLLPLLAELAVGAGALEHAEALLEEPLLKGNPGHAELLRFRLAAAREDPVLAGGIWDDAWGRAAEAQDLSAMLRLCRLGMEIGDFARVSTAYDPLVSNGVRLRRDVFSWLARETLRRNELTRAREIMKEGVVQHPGSVEFINDLSYLSLLLGEAGEDVIGTMEGIVADYPEHRYYRFTLAVAYLVNGFRREALETVQSVNIDAEDFSDSSRAIYAAVLSANDRRVPAREVLRQVRTASLLESERRLLEPFLGQL